MENNTKHWLHIHIRYNDVGGFLVSLFSRIFGIKLLCFVLALSGLVHVVETILISVTAISICKSFLSYE